MTEVVLRRARLGEAEALARLGRQTFQETFLDGFAIPYPPQDLATFLEASYTASAFAGKLADPRQATWVVERAGALLGYANAGPCTLPHPQTCTNDVELHRLYVLGAAQGLGFGRQLLDTALAWMEAQGAGPLWIGVWSGNLKAQRLYEAYGFVKVGDYRFPVGNWCDDEFILRRPHARPSPAPLVSL